MTEIVAARAEALWRAMVYVAVVQLHLVDNVLATRQLLASDVKQQPAGHWGTVPGTAWALAHVALAANGSATAVVPILGAGHAGVVQIALAWLTGELQALRPQYRIDKVGLQELARTFPDLDGLGAEVIPCLPAGDFVGGCIGGGLAFACGAAIDVPDRIIVPIIGDGECETPTTAATWLARRELSTGYILPVIHLNGFRMGSRSLLGAMSDEEVIDYFAGQGWNANLFRVKQGEIQEHVAFHELLLEAVASSLHVGSTAVVLRCIKGWGGPAEVGGRKLLGTANLHKTPITSPANIPHQLELLDSWLTSFRPHQLFDGMGYPQGTLAEALVHVRLDGLSGNIPTPVVKTTPIGPVDVYGSFAEAVTSVVYRQAYRGDFRLFSPDELGSNRLDKLVGQKWTHEILAEEVVLGWLAGWTASGRRGLLISYESFASLFATGLIAQLKQRRLIPQVMPSLNILLTSYGWHNVYTHGDPSLATTLLGVADSATRILTPADPTRLGAVLDQALDSRGRLNVMIAGKHSQVSHPITTISEEIVRGLAIWPHLSDPEEPDLTIVCAGDLAASVTSEAVPSIREVVSSSIRVVNINDLTVLGDPGMWPSGLTAEERMHYLGKNAAVLIATIGQPSAVWGLLANSLLRPVAVVGWREPRGPMSQSELAASAGLDVPGLVRAANVLLDRRGTR